MKESTGPSRFDLGDNEVVRERLRTIQVTVREMQETAPETVSLLMFGSMVKGYATEKSDIDGMIVIDSDTASKRLNRPIPVEIHWQSIDLEEVDFTSLGLSTSSSSIKVRFQPDIKAGYEKWVRECIKKRLPDFEDEQMKHLEAVPISFEILDQMLKIWRDSLQKFDKKKGSVPDKNIRVSEYLSQLFFLDVGNGGMRKYRAHIIKKLFSYGQLGHEMWNKIIGFTEIMERKISDKKEEELRPGALDTGIFTDVRYPRTLEDAKRVYS